MIRTQFLLLVAALVLFVSITMLCLLEDALWWAELARHFTLQYVWVGVLLALWALLLKKHAIAAGFTVLVLFHAAQIANVGLFYSQNKTAQLGAELNVLQFNALYNNRRPKEALAQLNQLAPNYDVLVMQEYPNNFSRYDSTAFFAAFPYHMVAKGRGTSLPGVAVFSKTPIETEEIVGNTIKSSHLRVTLPQHNVRFIVLHSITPLEKTFVQSRNAQHKRVFDELGQGANAAFAIGDFNQTPYASALQRMLAKNNLKLAAFPQSVLPTWPRFFPTSLMRIPIDHVVVNKNAHIISRKLVNIAGSDHMAVANVIRIDDSQP